jgi:DNA (cytosine-5)-methyltransferase 1
MGMALSSSKPKKTEDRLKIRLFEAFAGYGGASFAMRRTGVPFETVGFSENDKFAIELYEVNHPGVPSFGDITKIDPRKLPDFDLFTGGFPCQPFSQVGLGLGEEDIRGTLFYDIIRICKVKKPQHILLENVKGLRTNRHGKTLQTIVMSLEKLGYDVRVELLNTKDYGIPQNRERVWIYAHLGPLPLEFTIVPPKEKLRIFLKDLLDKKPEPSLFKSKEQIDRLMELYELDFIVSEPSCADLYNKNIRKDGISITILEPHHNKMRIVHPPKNGSLQVRNYSVGEHFRLMGFKDNEINYANQSYQQLCKRAANGWDIHLAGKIFKQIFESHED